MKLRYFTDTDTPFIELIDWTSSSSEAVSDNLIEGLDANGKPVVVTVVPVR
jgi:uncharacterized protein YuzE